MTDVQRKEETEGDKELKGDEDGPASSEGEADLEDAPLDGVLTDDENPLSDIDAAEANGRNQAHRSEVQWSPPGVEQRQGACETSVATSSCLPNKKRKLEDKTATGISLEDRATTVVPSESASQELSPLMRACGNNPDPSVPRTDQ